MQELFLQALRNVTALPPMHNMRSLRRLHLETMRGLTDLTPVRQAPALEQVRLVAMAHLQPEDLAPLAGHPTLRAAVIGLGSHSKNDRARTLLGLPDTTWQTERGAS